MKAGRVKVPNETKPGLSFLLDPNICLKAAIIKNDITTHVSWILWKEIKLSDLFLVELATCHHYTSKQELQLPNRKQQCLQAKVLTTYLKQKPVY